MEVEPNKEPHKKISNLTILYVCALLYTLHTTAYYIHTVGCMLYETFKHSRLDSE